MAAPLLSCVWPAILLEAGFLILTYWKDLGHFPFVFAGEREFCGLK